jgi:hypothetical protein
LTEPTLVTQAEYARMRGVSRQAISKAVAMGRLTLVDGRVQLSKADQEMYENTDVTQVRLFGDTTGKKRTVPEAPKPKRLSDLPPSSAKRKRDEERQGKVTFAGARAERETVQAELSQLDLAERKGALVPAADVRRREFGVARAARNLLLAIPVRLAHKLAAVEDPDECRIILTREMQDVCAQLAKLGDPGPLP